MRRLEHKSVAVAVVSLRDTPAIRQYSLSTPVTCATNSIGMAPFVPQSTWSRHVADYGVGLHTDLP
jgi:hypothetical protein